MKNMLLANGRRIAYYLDGRAQTAPLVLLHGFCEDASVWHDVLPHLRGLKVLRIDLPGFGGSDLPLTPGMDSYADAVCAVLNERSIKRCVLVGHSMGGYAALEFAAKYPERLQGLGLVHSHPYADSPERIENRRRGIEQLRGGKQHLYVSQLFPTLFAPHYAAAHPGLLEKLIRNGAGQPAEGIVAALEGMIARRDHTDTLRALPCPGLFFLGELDSLIPPDFILPAVHLPAVSKLHLLPGVGHMGMFEATETLAAALREFYQFTR